MFSSSSALQAVVPPPAGYVRRSSPLQADNFSLEAQKRGIAEECQKRGLPSPVFYVDDERSARGEQIAHRPAFQRLLQDVMAGRVSVVLVHTLDRWSRNVSVTLQSFRILAENHAVFLSVSEQIDYTTAEGRLHLTILAAFAAFFSETLAIHVHKGKNQRAFEGLGNGRVPYGYRSTGPKTPPEPDPQSFAGLRLMGEERMQGRTASQIAGIMNAAGYRLHGAGLGERPFTAPTVNAMLSNEFYAAFAPGDDRGTIVSQGQRSRGQHQAAFTREEWRRIREGAQMNYRAPHRAGRTHIYPFSGVVACVHCGTLLRVNGNGESHYVYYRDTAAQRQIPCPVQGTRHLRQDRLIAQFRVFLQSLQLPAGWQERVRQQIAEATPTAQEEQESWEREEQRLVVKRQRTLRQRRAGYISEEECQEELAAVALGLRQLQSWETAQLLEESLKLGEQLSDITARWSDASGEDQRRWMHLLVEPGGLAVDLETQQIAALAPRPALLPLLRLLDPAATLQKGAELVLLTSWQPVTRQIGPHALLRRISGEEQLPLETLSELFPSWQVAPFDSEAASDRGKIPRSVWPALVERLEQGASRTQMAQVYGVSVSALRRTERRARQALSLAAPAPHSRSKIPEAEWEQLLQQRDQGISLAHLAQISEVAPSTVRRTEQAARQQLQRAVRSAQTPGHIAPTEWPAILADLDQGGTFAQLARCYHVSARTIQRVETLARAQEGAPSRAFSRRWRLPPSAWPTILVYAEQGVSLTRLAEMYGVSLPTMRKVLQTAEKILQETQPLLDHEQASFDQLR